MTNERLIIETRALELFFPRKYRFTKQQDAEMILEVGVKTQSGTVYQLRIEMEADYPSSLPKVFIIYPGNLRDYYGNDMLAVSSIMHTMQGKNGFPQICHIWPSSWGPHRSLMQVAMKARIWLEAFEAHKITGKLLNLYLPENKNTII